MNSKSQSDTKLHFIRIFNVVVVVVIEAIGVATPEVFLTRCGNSSLSLGLSLIV